LDFCQGSVPDLAGKTYSNLPDLLAGFKGPYFQRERTGRKKKREKGVKDRAKGKRKKEKKGKRE